MAVSANGTLAAVGGYDNHIRIWTITASGPQKQTSRRASGTVQALAFSPDNRKLAIGADRVVELTTPDHASPPQRLAAFPAPVTALAYTPTGYVLAVGAEDGTVTLWDIPSRKRSLTLTSRQGPRAHPVLRSQRQPARHRRRTRTTRWWTLSQPWALPPSNGEQPCVARCPA
ncbi:WD40 repeat domain-containing protein [Streptomyces sp. ISL-98]|uniref:WD40 repeat domain-containing protein n=1 Tax=Streptomyces sp. ISL-98 TaxID=2819192 RepID=UPI0035AD78CB